MEENERPKSLSILPRSGFHGTKDSVLSTVTENKLTSSQSRNRRPRYSYSEKDKTYFTPSEEHAWTYANAGVNLRTLQTSDRPVVFPVKAGDADTIEKDKNMPAVGNLSLTSTGPLEITGEPEWGPPPQKYGGTVTAVSLPHINWHQFGAPNWVVHRPENPFDSSPFTSIDAVFREAHPHLETRRIENKRKMYRKSRSANELPTPVKVDPDQLEIPF